MVTGEVFPSKRTERVEREAGLGEWRDVQDWVSKGSCISIEYIEYPAYTDTNSPARFKRRQVRDGQPW